MNATSEKPANPDEYNGWTNRETWAFMLWLQNDEGLNAEAEAFVAEHIAIIDAEAKEFGEGIIAELYRSIAESFPRDLDVASEAENALRDIGSTWRINWREVAEHLNEWNA